jgi:cytochrome c peroxidase
MRSSARRATVRRTEARTTRTASRRLPDGPDARRSGRPHGARLLTLLALVLLVACRGRDRDAPAAPERAADGARTSAASSTSPGQPPAPRAPVSLPPPPPLPALPRGLPPLPSPVYSRTTPEKVELGRLLFFDPRLSASGKTSCASCHQPERGWADGTPRARTDGGETNLRHTPSLHGVGYAPELGWDGGMPTLEALVLSHLRGQLGRSAAEVAALAARSPGYAARFERAFGGEDDDDPLAPDHVAEALASFARTLVSGDSPWDRHEAEISGAVSTEAVQGYEVFNRRAGCATCHPPPHYTDFAAHARRGAGEAPAADPGRMRVTANPADQGAFRTPSLRGLGATAPYFHDGGTATLEAALDAELARGGVAIAPADRLRLLAFLRSLDTPPPARPSLELPALP